MKKDKTALGISDELRQFIEALVKEVVLEGEPFEKRKKYLQRFSEAEGINYTTLETNLSDLFETAEELQAHESKGNERFLRLLAKECYISHDVINKIASDINTKRRKLEEEEAKRRAEEDARRKREAEESAKAVRKAKEEAKKALEEAERERKAREAAEKKAEAERKASEERVRKAKEEAKKALEEAERERKARETAERKAEVERKASEERVRKAKEEAKKALEEAERERKVRETAERKAEAERKAREEAERKAKEKNRHLSYIPSDINKFFPYDGIVFGETKISDLPRLGYEKYKDCYYGPLGAQVSDENGDQFVDYIGISSRAKLSGTWTNLGFDFGLSYNQCMSWIRRFGFSIEVRNKPHIYFFDGRKTLEASFVATSSDGQISISFDFEFGNKHGEGYSVDSRNSLGYIHIKFLAL